MDTVHISLVSKAERKRLRANGLTFMECSLCGETAAKGSALPQQDSKGYSHKWGEYYKAKYHPWLRPEVIRLIENNGA